MFKIQVQKWKALDANGNEVEETSLTLLNILLSCVKPSEFPIGIESFRTMQRLSGCFASAEMSGELELENKDYVLLKSIVEKYIPSSWAFNKSINNAVDEFINAKEVN